MTVYELFSYQTTGVQLQYQYQKILMLHNRKSRVDHHFMRFKDDTLYRASHTSLVHLRLQYFDLSQDFFGHDVNSTSVHDECHTVNHVTKLWVPNKAEHLGAQWNRGVKLQEKQGVKAFSLEYNISSGQKWIGTD